MSRSLHCPRCQGSMAEGFLLDHTHGGTGVATWVEGAPVKSFWTGIKTGGRRKIEVKSYRCSRCGLLESYAPG